MFRSVKTRFTVLHVAMILFVSLLMGYLSYNLIRSAVEDVQKNHLGYVASTEAYHIKSLIESRENLLTSIALDENIFHYSHAYNDKLLLEYLSKYKKEFSSLSFVNKNGKEELRAADGKSQTPLLDISKTRLFEDISWEPNKVFSVYHVDPEKQPALVLNTGYFRQNFFGVFEGAVVGQTDLYQLLEPFLEFELGKNGYMILLETSGRVLLHPDRDKRFQILRNELGSEDELLLDAMNLNSGTGRVDIFGQDSFVAYAPVNDHHWILMAVLPYEEFIAEPTRYLNLFLFLFLFVSFIGVLLSLYLAISITKPVLKLTESSNSIAMGVLTERVSIESSDEIGRLGSAFNVMAHNLQMSKNKLDAEARIRDELITELETKNAELERYSYTVSHDLKSPLVTVKGFIGLLQQDIADNNQPRIDADLEQIGKAIDSMAELLESLLELSRIGRLINEPQKISLNDLFEQTIQHLQYSVQEANAVIKIQPDMPFILADRQRMQEVAQNLIENALKFRRPDCNPEIEISSTVRKNRVTCCVTDNGIGISEKYQQQIFGLFERLDLSYEGTGIGLALVKRIIEVHNGWITVSSQGEGKGARFCFTLPVSISEN